MCRVQHELQEKLSASHLRLEQEITENKRVVEKVKQDFAAQTKQELNQLHQKLLATASEVQRLELHNANQEETIQKLYQIEMEKSNIVTQYACLIHFLSFNQLPAAADFR